MSIEVISAFLTGLFIGSLVIHFVHNAIVQLEADTDMDELIEAWKEIRRLREQVARHIGGAP